MIMDVSYLWAKVSNFPQPHIIFHIFLLTHPSPSRPLVAHTPAATSPAQLMVSELGNPHDPVAIMLVRIYRETKAKKVVLKCRINVALSFQIVYLCSVVKTKRSLKMSTSK